MTNALNKPANFSEVNFTNIELSDVIDAPAIQEMMDDYYALTGSRFCFTDYSGKSRG